LAWYDWIYSCQHNFGPTYLAHYYSWAKPQNSRQIQIYKNWDPSIKRKVTAVDLALGVGVLLLLPKFLTWKPAKMTPDEEEKAKKISIALLIFVVCAFAYLRLYRN
jgi:hypothetical protein